MLSFPRWKVLGISLICLVFSLMAVPSFLPASAFNQLPAFARGTHINLGLDLAGGSQLLLEAETGDVARARGESMEETMRRELRTASPAISGQFSTRNGEVAHRSSIRPASTRRGGWPASRSGPPAASAAPTGPWPRPTAAR